MDKKTIEALASDILYDAVQHGFTTFGLQKMAEHLTAFAEKLSHAPVRVAVTSVLAEPDESLELPPGPIDEMDLAPFAAKLGVPLDEVAITPAVRMRSEDGVDRLVEPSRMVKKPRAKKAD